MNVVLYNISAPPEQVLKVTENTQGTTVTNVIFKDDDTLDITNPKIILSMDSEITKNVCYNYVKIAKLGRYYYIRKITTENGLMVFECEVDPLQSFHSDIRDSKQYVIRSENINNKMIVDSLLPLHSDHNILIKNFGDDVYVKNCPNVILETIGKGGTPS